MAERESVTITVHFRNIGGRPRDQESATVTIGPDGAEFGKSSFWPRHVRLVQGVFDLVTEYQRSTPLARAKSLKIPDVEELSDG